MYYLNSVSINPATRVVVAYDTDWHESPATWYGDDAVFHNLDGSRHVGNHNDADAWAIRGAMPYWSSEEDIFEALRKHYARAGYSVGCIRRENFQDAAFVATAPGSGEARAFGALMTQWLNGEFYRLELQTLCEWRAQDGRVRHEWETADAVSDVYADPYDDAEITALALDFFGEYIAA